MQKNLSNIEWTVLSLPPRFFSWRIRGNSLTWAFGHRHVLEQHYDCVLATSIVDLSVLRGMVPALTGRRTIVYFHENQFYYPSSPQAEIKYQNAVEAQLVNLYSALCADRVVFNSDSNRQTFLQGVDDLLAKLPDQVPEGIGEHLRSRSRVLPVPLEDKLFSTRVDKTDARFHLVWNHRWEYDKGPARLLRCLQNLNPSLSLCVHVVGQQFRQQPPEFDQIHALLKQNGWLGCWGFIASRNDYLKLLANADAVLSTALHDFQGLSVLEAYALKCLPIVPDRLAYQEFIPAQYRYPSLLNEEILEAKVAADCITRWAQTPRDSVNLLDPPNSLAWESLTKSYYELFEGDKVFT